MAGDRLLDRTARLARARRRRVRPGSWRRPPVRSPDGWFPTGDAGSIDADGYLTFVDRLSAAMTVRGATVFPATIERALYDAAGVSEAAVVEIGNRVVAAVVPDRDDLEIGAVLAEIGRTVHPGHVPDEIRCVVSIPRNAAGKVRRDALRALLARG